eukprot:scaffold22843_cov16-Prasinocladus_malaysianus.AAC.1
MPSNFIDVRQLIFGHSNSATTGLIVPNGPWLGAQVLAPHSSDNNNNGHTYEKNGLAVRSRRHVWDILSTPITKNVTYYNGIFY